MTALLVLSSGVAGGSARGSQRIFPAQCQSQRPSKGTVDIRYGRLQVHPALHVTKAEISQPVNSMDYDWQLYQNFREEHSAKQTILHDQRDWSGHQHVGWVVDDLLPGGRIVL